MTSARDSQFVKLASGVFYEQLISTDRAEEYAIEYLKMDIKNRRLTEGKIKNIANRYGEILEIRLGQIKDRKNLSNAQKIKITEDCIEEVLKWYKEENDEQRS